MSQILTPLYQAQAPTVSQSLAAASETVPFLSATESNSSLDSDVERGRRQLREEGSDHAGYSAVGRSSDDSPAYVPIGDSPRRPWQLPRTWSFEPWNFSLFSAFGAEKTPAAAPPPPPRRPALRRVLRLLLVAFMILGIFHFISLVCGFFLAFFPDDIDWPESKPLERIDEPKHGPDHWPTDITADTLPVGCHSHNDYWRKKPLFSALRAGCTGVEADVWLFDQDLYVGHHPAALTPSRTLRSLYINPLVAILDRQNPRHDFHPDLDTPRNGVFDADPAQPLVLLVDFKGDGEAVWPFVQHQLEPLREKKYLTHFNGSAIVEGPIVVVATGNAPFHRVVENTTYRDIFFDAPLDLMEKASPAGGDATASVERALELERAAAAGAAAGALGQGYSGSAPRDPNAYSIYNSYYASVSFNKAILGLPTLWRNRLTKGQVHLVRAQIEGAHARGLKARYWAVPAWPVSMRDYLWRVLAREGVDFLNVDNLKQATRGKWGKHGWAKDKGWWFP